MTAAPEPISPGSSGQSHSGMEELLGGLGAATPGSMRVSSPSLALGEVGRLFFFLYHPVSFKPCDLHGCRHHLLPVLAYNSWLDLGLFSWRRQRALNPAPTSSSAGHSQPCLHSSSLPKHSWGCERHLLVHFLKIPFSFWFILVVGCWFWFFGSALLLQNREWEGMEAANLS